MRISKNTHAGRNPHACRINVMLSVVVEVEPAGAHSSSRFIHFGLGGDGGKCSIAVIAVEIVAAKIVDHVQVGPRVSIAVTPRAGETISIIIDIQAGLFGAILKDSVAFVVK